MYRGGGDMPEEPNGTATQVAVADAYQAALGHLPPKEREALLQRRKDYGIARQPFVGLALSGGGIRSATFSLGLLRGLSELHLLQRLDYLSTVSGGGYAGSFFCGLFAPRGSQKAVVEPTRDTDLLGQSRAQAALAYLRQSGRYLTPGGGRDYVYAVTMLARNWLALALVVGMAIVLIELLLDAARAALFHFAWWCEFIGLIDIRWAEIALSPLALLIPFLLALVVGLGWAYWLTMSDVSHPRFRPPLVGTALVLLLSGYHGAGLRVCDLPRGAFCPTYPPRDASNWGAAAVFVFALIALVAWSIAAHLERDPAGVANDGRAMQEDRVRHRLAGWQALVSQLLFLVTAVALADSISYLFSAKLGTYAASLPPVMGALVPFAQWLVKRLAVLPQSGRPGAGKAAQKGIVGRIGPALAWIAGLLFVIAALAFWGNIAHHLSWTRIELEEDGQLPQLRPWFHWALLGALLFVLLASMTRGFVNLSSLASFYADRLCRAYLGAGNPQRIGLKDNTLRRGPEMAVQSSDVGDDMSLTDYYGKARGAPIHLINVTINETHGKGPATVQRDRHGLNMVISPDGMSYTEKPRCRPQLVALGDRTNAPKKAAPAQAPFFAQTSPPGQRLPLSIWIGISGAAFTTGLGSQTNLAKSLLAFLANVRLGYWWKSDQAKRRMEPSYLSLYREMTALFPGTDRLLWYLSDGGHFENTGVYELIRRKLPLIVVSDNGCDPSYGFEDVANLVRKCRIDFNAQITFLNKDDLDKAVGTAGSTLRDCFASPEQFAEGSAGHAIALVGRIVYGKAYDDVAEETAPDGTLLVIKPRLSQNGPSDLLRYLYDNPEFPQQSTLDQFFDEAQWESYYELGRLIALRLFSPDLKRSAGWWPGSMEPVAW